MIIHYILYTVHCTNESSVCSRWKYSFKRLLIGISRGCGRSTFKYLIVTLETPIFSLETPIFSLETPSFSSETQTISLETAEYNWRARGLQRNSMGDR